MSEIKFEGWFPDNSKIFAIFNTNAKCPEEITSQSFIKSPIRILNVENVSDKSLRERFTVASLNGDSGAAIRDNLPLILRGQSKDWRLVGFDVDVNPGGIALWYATRNPKLADGCHDKVTVNGKICGFGVVLVCGINYPANEEFAIYSIEDEPPVRYKIEIGMTDEGLGKPLPDGFTLAYITKFVGSCKIYDLEIREDNHGKSRRPDDIDSGQYYIGTLYI